MRHWRTWNRIRPQSAPARLIDRFAGSLDPALALLFEEASAARIVVDRHGNLVRASDVLWRMVGMAAALAPGAPLLALFVPGGREAIWQELGPLLRGQVGGEPLRPLSAELISGGAEPLAVSIAVAALREADGATGGALLSVRDIGPEVRLQAQLTQSQRLQAMGQLTGGVAHDFKNLLTAILGAADAVAAHVGLDGEAREDLEQIRATAARGTALVQKLLAFSRRETLQPQVLEVNEVVSGIAALLRRLLGSRIRLELKLEQPGSRVRADPTALDQVLMNLAMNARDAMPDGGPLTLRTGQLTLQRALLRGPEAIPPGRYVLFEVRDGGMGIPADVLPHIFEPFYTTRHDRGGSGLGLATVHGIVRQSEGFLDVESEVGQGTSMRLYLPRWDDDAVSIPLVPLRGGTAAPIAAPAAARRRDPPGPTVSPAARGPILLVEDETSVRRIAERALIRHGWQVLAAESAEAALELLDRERPPRLAAVVTDLVMPGQDGTALVRAVRERLGAPALPAILVSGYAAEDLQREIITALGDAGTLFLPKPYEIAELAARLLEVTDPAASVASGKKSAPFT